MKNHLALRSFALLALLFALALHLEFSPEKEWQKYEAWLGEPTQVQSYANTGGSEWYEVAASDELTAQWREKLGIKQGGETPQPVQLTGAGSPHESPYMVYLKETEKGQYNINIRRALTEEESAQATKELAASKEGEESEESWGAQLINSTLFLLIFCTPALWGLYSAHKNAQAGQYIWWRIWLRATLFASAIWALYSPFLLMWGSYSVDKPLMSIVGGLITWPIINLFSCTLLYLPWFIWRNATRKKP